MIATDYMYFLLHSKMFLVSDQRSLLFCAVLFVHFFEQIRLQYLTVHVTFSSAV